MATVAESMAPAVPGVSLDSTSMATGTFSFVSVLSAWASGAVGDGTTTATAVAALTRPNPP